MMEKEFTIQTNEAEKYSFMFPFLDKVIEIMIANNRNDNAEILLKKVTSKTDVILKKIFGQISKKTEPYQMVLKNRLFLYSLVVILVFFIILSRFENISQRIANVFFIVNSCIFPAGV